jgi:hydroxymethylpyrimidine pyrophosphatase-like HAD family hydrolase
MKQANIVLKATTENPKILKDFGHLERLFNQVVPKLDISTYLEVIENGYLLFFGNFNDFQRIYKHPPDRKKFEQIAAHISSTKNHEIPFNWHIEIVTNTSNRAEKELYSIIQTYTSYFLANCKMIVSKNGKKKLQISYQDKDLYQEGQKWVMEYLNYRLSLLQQQKG